MSTLWTPDGERKVPPATDEQPTAPPTESAEPELTPEQQEQARAMAKELAEARARILATEASTVVANHAFGIYELAAIHLTADEPNLSEAQVAIDALAALVNGLKGRLGEVESTLVDALKQAQLLYVQRAETAKGGADGGPSHSEAAEPDEAEAADGA